MTLPSYISGFEGGQAFFEALIELALDVKADPTSYYAAKPLAGKVLASLFLNPSLRTRTSFEVAMYKLGGHMVTLAPGQGMWGVEFDRGVVMNGLNAEHIVEAAGVLSSYADGLAMRAFSRMENFEQEMKDEPVRMLAKHASVPTISLESACYHPCQALADAITMRELLGNDLRGKKFALTWTTHPKMCGVAVPHSALLTAARLGMDVSVAHPEGYELHPDVMSHARQLSEEAGGSLAVTDNMEAAASGAHVVYAKAWGSHLDYGQQANGPSRNQRYGDWTVDAETMALGDDPYFMHCLPVRRNVVVTDSVIDSPRSAVQQQAANRLWAQMALLMKML